MNKYAALWRASVVLLLVCFGVKAWAAVPAACDTKGGISNFGVELSAQQAYDATNFLFYISTLTCQNGVVTAVVSTDFQGTSADGISVVYSSNLRLYRNTCGSHVIAVHKLFRGTIAGIDFSNSSGPAAISGNFYYPNSVPCADLFSNGDMALTVLGENGRPCPTMSCGDQGSPSVSDPITTSSGNTYYTTKDFSAAQSDGVFIQRDYNSMQVSRSGVLGRGWTGNYLQSILLNVSIPCPAIKDGLTLWTGNSSGTGGGPFSVPAAFAAADTNPKPNQPFASGSSSNCVPPPPRAIALRPSGRGVSFNMSGGKDINGLNYVLTALVGGGYTLLTPEDALESYDSGGVLQNIVYRSGRSVTLSYNAAKQLQAVQDSYGRTLAYQYTAQGLISQIMDPSGKIYRYAYNGGNLTQVLFPDNTSITYQYEITAFPNLLTGQTDEKGVRYSTWAYDGQGRSISSELVSGGIDKTIVDYSSPASPVITTPLGVTQTQTLLQSAGIARVSQLQEQCSVCSGQPVSYAFDAVGNLIGITDKRGVQTTMQYDLSRNLETSRTEAAGTPQARTTSTQWHATFRLPVKIASPLNVSTLAYDAKGNLLTRTEQATTDANGSQGFSATTTGNARVWSFTYNTRSQVLTSTAPDLSVSTYQYDTAGNLTSLTNALGQATTFTAYDGNGLPLRKVDTNGLVTVFTYDPRQRLISRTVGSETTTYTYDAAGQPSTTAFPDGTTLTYTWDSAHRLARIADNLGNHADYTLDAAGNRIGEDVFDPTSQLSTTVTRAFDALGRLQAISGVASE